MMEQFRGNGETNSNQKGQIAIEAVLLAVVLTSFFLVLKNKLRETQAFQKLTTSSAARIKRMAEYGTWREVCKPVSGAGQEKAANCHPNSINRSLSSAPD